VTDPGTLHAFHSTNKNGEDLMASKEIEHRPALIIIDMVKDNFDEHRNLPITPFARKIIAPINSLIRVFRERMFPIVFATDAFHTGHFFFSGRMKPHSLAGTTGAEVVEELDRRGEDYWMPKPSMSAFFKTGLEGWLRDRQVTLCALCGIATNFCVLASAFDALANGFRAVLVEDCSAAASEKIHAATCEVYRKNPLQPLFRVMASEALIEE
jgi:nicotinamidase-related amidase